MQNAVGVTSSTLEPMKQVLKELEFMIWGYGAENVLIGVFQKLLHYYTHR